VKNSSANKWQDAYFGSAYLEIYSEHLYEKNKIAAETDFIIKTLKLNKTTRLLDIACGFGKHLLFFFKRAVPAFGLDINRSYLQFAMRKFPASHAKKSPLVQGTMTRLPFQDGAFDAAISLFNSFGYYPLDCPDADLTTLKEVSRALKSGGRFFLEIPNKQPVVRMACENPQTLQCGLEFAIHEIWEYDKTQNLLHNKTTFNVRGKTTQAGYCLRLYTKGELAALFKKAGLSVVGVYGDYNGAPYSRSASPYLILIGKKETSRWKKKT